MQNSRKITQSFGGEKTSLYGRDIVKAKKFLGQHFLKDEHIAQRIVSALPSSFDAVVEVGPGMGVLTKYLILCGFSNFKVVEIDSESVCYLKNHYPELDIVEGDFLKLSLKDIFHGTCAVIGNFPYNISSQILFRVYEQRNDVGSVVGMFQKEVAERVTAKPGSKTYGILSVLLGAFYAAEYLFTVDENVFNPPPKVKSAVIRLTRNEVASLDCDEDLFRKVVKAAFNQRRKTLRNALKSAGYDVNKVSEVVLCKRAEQLSVEDFIGITKAIEQ